MTRWQHGCTALMLAGAAALVASASRAHTSSAELIFAGPAMQAVVSVSPANPSLPPSPEPEPEPEWPTCPSGQRWLEGTGCVNPCARFGRSVRYDAALDACLISTSTDNDLDTRPCTHTDGAPSHQIRERSRPLYSVFLLDGTRTEMVGPWGSWSAWGTCLPPYVPPPPPSPDDPARIGETVLIKALICGPGDAGYHAVNQFDWTKEQVIAHYRDFGTSRRCPEAGGYAHWLTDWHDRAVTWVQNNGMWHEYALGQVWSEIATAMNTSGLSNGEFDPPQGDGGIEASHQLCAAAARERWPGFQGTVRYRIGSGNVCEVTSVN